MPTYRTFIREATNWQEFAHAEKQEIDTELTLEEALANCKHFNTTRTALQIADGAKMEFEAE